MATIEVILRKGMQNLGYIRLDENGEPFYSYTELQATKMTIENAIKLVNKLSNKYLFKIHRNKEEKEKQVQTHYILC